MFDDWAYQELYAIQSAATPQAPPQAIASVSESEKRERSGSLSFSVAQSGLEIDNVMPPFRSRARSLPRWPEAAHVSIEPHESSKSDCANPAETPLTRRDVAHLWDRQNWLGSAYDPSLHELDEQLWEARIAEFAEVSLHARLASRLADSQRIEAQVQLQHIAWITHELRDMEQHDISPLSELAQRADALAGRRKLALEVKTVLSDVYDALDRIVRILRGPAPRAVPKLPEIFAQIDSGITFCAAHPDFVQITQTAQGFRNCRKRALDIAKAYSVHELRKVTERVSAKVRANPGAAQAMVHAKFEADASHCSGVIALIANHSACADGPELSSIFTELQIEYFGLRTQLIGNETLSFAEPLLEFTQLSDDFFDAARSSMVQFKQLFSAEQRGFTKLFGAVTSEFNNWLNDVSDPLYSALRRLIIRETDIGRLCQLIVLVHNESDEVRDTVETSGASEGEPSRVASMASSAVATPSAASADPFRIVYTDAQQRLVFRADLVIDGFASYVATAKDFSRARYPVVDQALGLLSQVYQLLSTQVFNDLAHRCIRECVAALDVAVANRVAASGLSAALKVHIFHIKQLLLLQSQIVEFDLEHTVLHEVDFSGIRRLLELPRGYSFRELLSLAWDSVPQVVEYMFDAMEELYASLRRAVDRLCAALLAKSSETLKGSAAAHEKAAKFRDAVAAQFKDELKPAIAEHISDPRVANVLLDSAQEAVSAHYADFYRTIPSEELTERVMDPETFTAWVSSTLAAAEPE